MRNSVLALACLIVGGLSGISYSAFHRVGIGVYVLNVAGLELSNGVAYIDFVLTVRRELKEYPTFNDIVSASGGFTKRVCPNISSPGWVEWNGTAGDFLMVNMDRKGELESLDNGQWRVKGQFYFRTNLKDWPFETQTLEMILELKDQMQTENFDTVLCSITDYSGLSSSIRFPGDRYLSLTTSHTVEERCWPPFSNPNAVCTGTSSISSRCPCAAPPVIHHNESSDFSCRCKGGMRISSRYKSQINFHRPENTAFIKVFLPPLFIDIVTVLTYVLPLGQLDTRVSICAATLMAAVFFHVSLLDELPPTSTLTEADYLMIDVYVVNLFAWTFTLVLMLCKNAKHVSEKFTESLYRFTRILGPIISLSSFVMTFYHSIDNWWMWVLSFLGAVIIAYFCLRLQERIKLWLEIHYPAAPSPAKLRREVHSVQTDESGASSRETPSSSDDTPLLTRSSRL